MIWTDDRERPAVTAPAVAWRIALAAMAVAWLWPHVAAPAQDPAGAEKQQKVRGAHEAAEDPAKTFTDDLGMTITAAPVDHPGRVYPASDDFPTGPDVGERLPDFALPNQHGELIDFHKDREGKRAAVVFLRSAVW